MGQDWRDAIAENMERSDALIILFSEECNSSKQLRKELALADSLEKFVVPVLIEPIQPRGHFLYELAALNWIQIHPHPETKIELLADRLIGEFAAVVDEAPMPETATELEEKTETETKPDDVESWDTIRKIIARKYISSKAARPPKLPQLRSFLPFKRYEIALIIALAGLAAGVVGAAAVSIGATSLYWVPGVFAAALAIVSVALMLVVAVLIFPYRYARRQVGAIVAYVYQVANLAFLTGPVLICVLLVLFATEETVLEQYRSDQARDVVSAIAMWLLFALGLAILAPLQVMLGYAERKLYKSMLARMEKL
jgi:hypothetical protein